MLNRLHTIGHFHNYTIEEDKRKFFFFYKRVKHIALLVDYFECISIQLQCNAVEYNSTTFSVINRKIKRKKKILRVRNSFDCDTVAASSLKTKLNRMRFIHRDR